VSPLIDFGPLRVGCAPTAAWRISRLALAVALLAPALGGSEAAEVGVSRERIESALAEVRPALVQLRVVTRHFAEGRAVRFPSAGSGVIVTEDGHVLTNYHVAGRGARVQATLANGEIVEAEIVTLDPLTDLSVLRLRRPDDAEPLRPARLAEREPRVGEPVLALGSPLALASSVTLGIVSNTRRVFTDFLGSQIEDLDLDGEPTGLFTRWIQHDALILPGNSGGPLIDLEGHVVGINELGAGGLGFAIPAGIARRVLAGALGEGRVRRADLGFTVLPVARLGREQGALVASVTPSSPAEVAGLEPGDFLLAIAGEQVAVRFFEEVPELYRRIADLEIGSEVDLGIERAGARRELRARTREREEASGAEEENRRLGISVQELSAPMARLRQLEPGSGLLVTSVRTGFPAASARPAIEPGDLLLTVGSRRVQRLDDLGAALAAEPAGELLVELRRRDERLLAVLRIGEERSARRGGELPKAWLGARTQVVTPQLARLLGRPDLRGFRITQVYPWTEAERAGLRAGDVLRALADEPLEGEREQDAENLRRAVEERGIGEKVELRLVRDGREMALPVTLEARPVEPSEARTARQELLGFAVREVTLFDRAAFHWRREQQGVLVTEVVSGGFAQMAGLAADDLVLALDGREVTDLASFEDALRAIASERPPLLRVFVRRGARTHFVLLEQDWNGNGARREEGM
jgi:serine protease Do